MPNNLKSPINSPQIRSYKIKQGMVGIKGQVTEALPSATFNVKLENGDMIFAPLGGRMRQNYIRVSPGDTVIVELDPEYKKYEKPKGRIIYRER
jgi:translation initiation factor IF-1